MHSENHITETTPLLGEQRTNNGFSSVGNPDSSFLGEDTPQPNAVVTSTQPHDTVEGNNRLKYIVPAISIGIFLAAADQTIIAASYAQIGSDLQALNLTSWIATSYFLTLTSFQPLYGRLSDIFGRKPCLLFSYAIFGIGCLFCGLARNIYELVAARAFQGIGGGGMTTVVSILMTDLVPLRDRGLWQGIINIVWAFGSGIGAPLGGILTDYIGWRWAFILQAPICLMAFIAVAVTFKPPLRDTEDWLVKFRRIDFLGAIVLVAAVFSFLLGIDRGSNVSWGLPITIVSLSVSAILSVSFIFVEAYMAVEPFAPGHVIFNRVLFACFACNFFNMGVWLGPMFYITLFFQAADGVSATVAGLRLIPSIIFGVIGSLFGGIVIKKTGKVYWINVAAYSCLTAGAIMTFLFSGAIVYDIILLIVSMTIATFGTGIGITTTLIALIAHVSPDDQAVVTACSYLFRSLGSVLGVSVLATVIQQLLRNRLRAELHDSKDVDRIVEGVRESLDFINTLDPGIRDTVRSCYGWSINIGLGSMIAIAFCALLSSFFIREQKINR